MKHDPFEYARPSRVRVSALTALPLVQVRKEVTHEPTVQSYATRIAQGIDLGPILVARVGRNDKTLARSLNKSGPRLRGPVLVVVDGFHRLEAHRKLGLTHIVACVADCELATARWAGSKRNIAHGRPLKMADFRRLFRAFMQARAYRVTLEGGEETILSLREIVRELGGGMAPTTVAAWMQKDFRSVYLRNYSNERGQYNHERPERPEDHRAFGAEAIQEELGGLAKLAACLAPADVEAVAATMALLASELAGTPRAPVCE